jgi:hypothetical protein
MEAIYNSAILHDIGHDNSPECVAILELLLTGTSPGMVRNGFQNEFQGRSE